MQMAIILDSYELHEKYADMESCIFQHALLHRKNVLRRDMTPQQVMDNSAYKQRYHHRTQMQKH